MAAAIIQKATSTVPVTSLGVEYLVTDLAQTNKTTSDGSTKFNIGIGTSKYKGNIKFSTSSSFTTTFEPDSMSAIDSTGTLVASFNSTNTNLVADTTYYISFDLI